MCTCDRQQWNENNYSILKLKHISWLKHTIMSWTEWELKWTLALGWSEWELKWTLALGWSEGELKWILALGWSEWELKWTLALGWSERELKWTLALWWSKQLKRTIATRDRTTTRWMNVGINIYKSINFHCISRIIYTPYIDLWYYKQ